MATNIKHTLYNLEVPPPPGVWPHIESRLDAEFDAAELPVAQKMHDISVTPPPGVWADITVQLDTELKADEASVGQKMYELLVTPPAAVWKKIAARLPRQPAKKEGRLISMHSRKAIAAAAAMVLLAIGAWYFSAKNNSTDIATVTPQEQPSPVSDRSPARLRTMDTEIGERPVEREQLSQKPLAALTDVETNIINRKYGNRHGARRTAWYDYQPIATSYSGMDDVQVDFTENNNPTVEAPLIRDAKGQVILDKKLISPDDCYITVTSPNGEQTRISSKFLHIISAINQDVEPQDEFDLMTRESSLWKIRFSEWKEKFLHQASFVPTATSFTDILELRDLLVADEE
ncbi:hypothetical protein [Niastella populi]|uniref:Uncharacterized protein n=1 Tax=Niastella populi TaxID=550983 RepID=A0A1V9FLV8_9BACT|nr:hypothetical protein [Niastella populi]OQP59332.1 hypothetical protein A4R26_21170 [Niastella populi]